jgi:integrase
VPRARHLTYDKSLGWWVKVVRGKKVYLLKASAKGDRESYLKALSIYQQRLPELLSQDSSTALPAAAQSYAKRTTRSHTKQLRYAVRQYLRHLQARTVVQTQGRLISQGHVDSVTLWLEPFVIQLGDDFALSRLHENDLLDYLQAQTALVRKEPKKKPGTISGNTLRQRLVTVKAFLRWCWRQRLLDDLPRNLDDLRCGITTPDKTPFNWKRGKKGGKSELRQIIDECKRRDPLLYLCCLLGLNCGFTMRDIADLKASEYRWKSTKWKRIKRHRSKTTGFGSWVLWSETERMLKELMVVTDADYNSDKRLLAGQDGLPLLPHDERGRCPISRAFKRVVKKVCGRDDPRSFKTLRKTGATLCALEWPGTEVLFLAHEPSTMAAKFYVDTNLVGKIDWVLCKIEHKLGLSEVFVRRYSEEPAPPKRSLVQQSEDERVPEPVADASA